MSNVSSTTTPMMNTTPPVMIRLSDVYNYTCSQKGLLLPAINEYTWSIGVRAFLYLFGLLWCFLAVAIIADIFMCAIERITSKTTIVRVPDPTAPGGMKELEVKVWNDTVANLSLLALGTSAPEILLSVIEIVGNNFVAGEIGPGTIVGSAAFNLLVISAICIVAIPTGEIRRVKSFKVFVVTAFTCVFAYVWLALVLLVISPGIVELWEAIVTFLMFPLLIVVAYFADRDFCLKKKKQAQPGFVGISLSETTANKYTVTDEEGGSTTGEHHGEAEIMRLAKDLGRIEDLPEEEAAKIAAKKLIEGESHNRGWYRINATRVMTGGKKLIPQVMTSFQNLYERIQLPEEERAEHKGPTKHMDHSLGGTKPVIEFTAAAVAVLENEGKVRVGIRRLGKLDVPVTVRVETINGTALAGEDYKAFNDKIKFGANEILRQIFIEIVDDFEWEPDEFFFVKLTTEPGADIALGNISICQITIINDDEPGLLEFAKPSIVIKESSLVARVPVQRINGADGHVSVTWKTKDITAKDGIDYKGGEGELQFDNQEINRTIDITLFESDKPERDESFQIDLLETTGGAQLGKIKKTIITIVNDDEYNGLVSRILSLTKANLDSLQLEQSTYVTQFRNAMNVNGGDLQNATFLDYILHFATFFWKILFAFVPPSKYLGGWPAFCISLAVIGFLTAIIGDLAGVFGCLIGLEDSITAITLVALGTSMPDMFASKTAAIMEKYADSSVGNVNGSNSVNVFLGLGLSWLIATIYWNVKEGKDFEVPPGSLGFSVVLYTLAAVIALFVLVLRRFLGVFGKGELGGAVIPKYLCAALFISLWVMYILFSALQAKKIINVQI
ncbi:sodium/calcium exchanger 1-like isoform X2 [Gigantopelta aegis]|uniref:sodium/calcium exchanger 1-like isoform X2 n=1 Tax=Gigantopelta aegis TaxID=1735272 RepID=UPI001B8886B6|nr:sodium/calcium exchanger 1-like isoform X2 [Gigantopelta aegis]